MANFPFDDGDAATHPYAMRFLCFFLAACGGTSPTSDASVDAVADAPLDAGSDAVMEAGDAGKPMCKVGLPAAPTPTVSCGASACMTGDSCCTDMNVCKPSCAQLDIAWRCDRNAHCGTNQFCCIGFLFGDTSKCPSPSASIATRCENAPCSDKNVCQVDGDCPNGMTCYGVSSQSRPAYGVCI